MARPRVLISAFSCNPEMGSEPGVGHWFISRIQKHCDLTVITEELQNRAAIERYQACGGYGATHFRYVRWPLVDRTGKRKDQLGFFSYYQAYRDWQKRAMQVAQEETHRLRYDMIHHLTMQGYREPGYMWRLREPFLWGPVGGHAQVPWRYFGMLGQKGILQQGTRNIGNWLLERCLPRVLTAARSARAIIVNTEEERRAFRRLYGVDSHVIAEFGTEPGGKPRVRKQSSLLRIAWSGAHIPRKALPILLQALALLPEDLECETHILGDGPENARWRRLAERLGVNGRCVWHGRLPRAEALSIMRGCDVFALTSLLDGNSCVLLEALSEGLPVICHRICGFPDSVNDDCSVLVPISKPVKSFRAFAEAISRLSRDEAFYNRLAAAVHIRAAQMTWDERERQIMSVYKSVLSDPSQ
jgi:glycosyltransferase involved in cell wall biosynthesis